MKELVNLPLENHLNQTDATFSKNENDIVFKELSGAKFHHGGSFKKDSSGRITEYDKYGRKVGSYK